MQAETQDGRLLSLDWFRGLTIAGMILVNSPGNEHAYAPLEHAEWHGCTPTDLVFPFFLFIVGTAIVFSLARRKESGAASLGPLFKRFAVLFGLGLLLNAIPNWHPASLRILGVLQRIALCYMACALLFLKTGPRAQICAAVLLLAGYWLALTRLPWPGHVTGDLSQQGCLASMLDRFLLGPHTFHQGPFDPEGVLSTLPAVATTILGMLAGYWLRGPRTRPQKAWGLVIAGAAAAAAGWLWGLWFPLNKSLWTSSYALFTAGLACGTVALCYWLADIKGWRAWGKPFEVLGVNAIAAYVLPILMLKALVYTRWPGLFGDVQPRVWLCGRVFGTWLSAVNASLAFALCYVALWTAVFWVFYRKRVFFKA